jgi:hypothetical protein
MVRFGGDLKVLTNPHLRFLNEDQCRKVHETNVALLGKEHPLDAAERAQQRAREIMENHQPESISEGVLKDLAEVAERWHQH